MTWAFVFPAHAKRIKVVRFVVFLSFLIVIFAPWCLLMRTRSRICNLVSASFCLWSGLSGPVDCIPVHVKNPKTDVFDEIHLLSQLVFILCFFLAMVARALRPWFTTVGTRAKRSLSLGDICFIARNFVSFVFLGVMQRCIQLEMPYEESAMGWLAPPSATTSRSRCSVATLFSWSRRSPIRLPRTQRPAHARREKEHTVRTRKREITE